MIYLKDTCILIKNIDSLGVINILDRYKTTSDEFGLTDIIIDELKPGKSVEESRADKSRSVLNMINILDKSHSVKVYNVKDEGIYKKNFDKMRRAFYGHLKNPKAVREALQSGKITEEQFRNKTYIYKDYGECSCIAVAMEHPQEISIVTQDKGRIFLKEDINLFEKFKESHGIKVIEYKEWDKEVTDKHEMVEMA